MTIDEFFKELKKTGRKFYLDEDNQIRSYGKYSYCPINAVAKSKNCNPDNECEELYETAELLGLTDKDIVKIADSADNVNFENSCRKRLLHATGLYEKACLLQEKNIKLALKEENLPDTRKNRKYVLTEKCWVKVL
jgi:hypothetical protein